MNKKVLLAAGLALAMALPAGAFEEGDFQIWNTDVQEIRMSERSKLSLEEEFRWGDNASEFFYHHYDVGFFADVEAPWSLGGGYRQVFNKSRGKFNEEYAPYLTASLSGDLGGIQWSDRNRFESRHFENQPDSGRYRNKLTVKLPVKWTSWELQPFVAEEIFLRFDDDAFNENRFSSGLSVRPAADIQFEMYYMLRSTESSDKWTDSNVLGMNLRLRF